MAKPFLKRVTKTFFIFFNILLSALFLAGANIQYFHPLHWWFVGLLAISLPYLILLLIVFFLLWVSTRSAWLLLPVICLAAGWHAIQNIIPFNYSSEFKIEKGPNTLRVMSWNVEQFDILEHKTHPEVKREMLDL